MPTIKISFEPVEWIQEIGDYQDIEIHSRHLRADCRPASDCDLLLDGIEDIRKFALIQFGIIDGPPAAEQLEKSRLSKQALGGIWYNRGHPGGWFHLKEPDSYAAVWDQVRYGSYLDCTITLGVGSVHSEMGRMIWNTDQPLSIEIVSFQFIRKTNINKGLFGGRRPSR